MNYNQEQVIKIMLEHSRPFVCFLSGTLGAGKTTLMRKYIKGLGCEDFVKSPSYSLVEYFDEIKLLHLDLYRVEQFSREAFFQLGIEDYLESYSICIEWPEKLKAAFIKPHMHITISVDAQGNRLYQID